MASRWQDDRLYAGVIVGVLMVGFFAAGAAGLYRASVSNPAPDAAESASVSADSQPAEAPGSGTVTDLMGGVISFGGGSGGGVAVTSSSSGGGDDGGLIGLGGVLEGGVAGTVTGAAGNAAGTAGGLVDATVPGLPGADSNQPTVDSVIEQLTQTAPTGPVELGSILPTVGF